MRRHLIWILVFAVLAPASVAKARDFTSQENAVYYAAIDFWGGKEPRNCKWVNREILPQSVMQIYAGQSNQPPLSFTKKLRGMEACSSSISEDITLGDPYEFCLVVFHEVGHLKGYGHSEDIHNLMYPFVFTRFQIVPECMEANLSGYTAEIVQDRERVEQRNRELIEAAQFDKKLKALPREAILRRMR